MNEKLARIVKQHAETSRLFGVDFVPRYRAANSADDDEELAADSKRLFSRPQPGQATLAPEVKPPLSGAQTAPHPATTRPPAVAVAYEPAGKQHASQSKLDSIRARYITDSPHRAQGRQTDHSVAKIVFGEGDPCARLMFIGDSPGAEEDAAGRPFVGRAGDLLGKMIQAMGLSRQAVYLTSVFKVRLPQDTTPQSQDFAACVPYLFDQIAAVQPEVIVTLGLLATKAVLGMSTEPTDSVTIESLRNHWAEFHSGGAGPDGQPLNLRIAVMPTLHPSYLLANYDPATRKLVWDDLQLVMGRLGLKGAAATK